MYISLEGIWCKHCCYNPYVQHGKGETDLSVAHVNDLHSLLFDTLNALCAGQSCECVPIVLAVEGAVPLQVITLLKYNKVGSYMSGQIFLH
jgi:hypothetical protein